MTLIGYISCRTGDGHCEPDQELSDERGDGVGVSGDNNFHFCGNSDDFEICFGDF